MSTRNHAPSKGIHLTGVVLFAFLFSLFNSCVEEKVEPVFLGSIQGVILSKYSDVPIANVEVTTAPVTSQVYTDAEGKFLFESVPEGEYSLLSQAENYSRESIKVSVTRNEITEITIKLSTSVIVAPRPINPVPTDKQSNLPLSDTLRWSVDNTFSDSLHYAVTLFEANRILPILKVNGLSDTTLVVESLKYNTIYYWQVSVQSSTGYSTLGDIWQFRTVPFPNNPIVFASKIDGNYEIYSSDLAGDSLTRITHTSSFELGPVFNSTRDVIAFSSNNDIDHHIYIMNRDGSGVKKVTTLPIAGYHSQGTGFSWSPDYGKFIYGHYDKLYRIDQDGTNLTLLAMAPANRNFRACHWTSVGNKIVVETVGSAKYDNEIYLMNADGTDTVRLVDNLPGIIESPSFSIDGKEVLYTTDASGYESADGRQLDARIYIINIDTKEVTDVSGGKPSGTNDLQPRFSPTGAKIIFTNASNDGAGVRSVWIMDRSGLNREKLFDHAEMPSWH